MVFDNIMGSLSLFLKAVVLKIDNKLGFQERKSALIVTLFLDPVKILLAHIPVIWKSEERSMPTNGSVILKAGVELLPIYINLIISGLCFLKQSDKFVLDTKRESKTANLRSLEATFI